jgi:hypothetical protein
VHALLPEGFEPLTRDGRAFWSIVICRVERMRPRGLPRLVGSTYWHVAYRVYSRAAGLDGLHFLRSDVAGRFMAAMGNLMTDFRFHVSDIRATPATLDVVSRDGGGDARLRVEDLPALASPADSLLRYRPLALAPGRRGIRVAKVERDESRWRETPVRVAEARWGFFERLGLETRLERAVRVDPIDYVWRLNVPA